MNAVQKCLYTQAAHVQRQKQPIRCSWPGRAFCPTSSNTTSNRDYFW